MAEKYRFFDSTLEQERLYSAAEFAEYFATLITSGVFGGQLDSLQVTPHQTELKTIVATGKAFLAGYYYENDAPLDLIHTNPDPLYDRIDRVVVRLDRTSYTINAKVITGIPASTPVAPVLKREDGIYDIPLAQVRIKAGQSYIDISQVTDDREYARYQAKPAWYPRGQVPVDAWMYSVFKSQLTPQEKADIEANPYLMAIINDSEIAEITRKMTPNSILETLFNATDVGLKLLNKIKPYANIVRKYHPLRHVPIITTSPETYGARNIPYVVQRASSSTPRIEITFIDGDRIVIEQPLGSDNPQWYVTKDQYLYLAYSPGSGSTAKFAIANAETGSLVYTGSRSPKARTMIPTGPGVLDYIVFQEYDGYIIKYNGDTERYRYNMGTPAGTVYWQQGYAGMYMLKTTSPYTLTKFVDTGTAIQKLYELDLGMRVDFLFEDREQNIYLGAMESISKLDPMGIPVMSKTFPGENDRIGQGYWFYDRLNHVIYSTYTPGQVRVFNPETLELVTTIPIDGIISGTDVIFSHGNKIYATKKYEGRNIFAEHDNASIMVL